MKSYGFFVCLSVCFVFNEEYLIKQYGIRNLILESGAEMLVCLPTFNSFLLSGENKI